MTMFKKYFSPLSLQSGYQQEVSLHSAPGSLATTVRLISPAAICMQSSPPVSMFFRAYQLSTCTTVCTCIPCHFLGFSGLVSDLTGLDLSLGNQKYNLFSVNILSWEYTLLRKYTLLRICSLWESKRSTNFLRLLVLWWGNHTCNSKLVLNRQGCTKIHWRKRIPFLPQWPHSPAASVSPIAGP